MAKVRKSKTDNRMFIDIPNKTKSTKIRKYYKKVKKNGL